MRAFALFACALACAFACPSPGLAQTPLDSARPKPTSVETIGTLRVERYGSGSPAMIFIPGLAAGSWEWDGAVARFAPSHTVYLVTLAGFDGLAPPPQGGSPLDLADASLFALIANGNIDRPIVVGHELGGFLALRFGTEHPALVRDIVSIDYGPVSPSLADLSPQQRSDAANAIAKDIGTRDPIQFFARQKDAIATEVTAPVDAGRIAAFCAASDQNAIAAYAFDLFGGDLRPQLANLTTPTLEVAPVPTQPSTNEGALAAASSPAQRAADYKAHYAALFTGTPHLTIVTIPNSRHYVMFDRPKALFDAISAFAGL